MNWCKFEMLANPLRGNLRVPLGLLHLNVRNVLLSITIVYVLAHPTQLPYGWPTVAIVLKSKWTSPTFGYE